MTRKSLSYKKGRKAKWIIYPSLFGLFAVLLGLLLLTANGYWPSFTEDGFSFKKTGMIIVAVRPLDASIYVNGKYKEKSTFHLLPNRISNLLSGTYNIRIEKEGYRTWEKNIIVEPGLVSWANYVLLFPEKLTIESVKQLSGLPTSVSDDKRHYLYTGVKEGSFYADSYESSGLTAVSYWPRQTDITEDWLKSPKVLSASYSQNGDRILFHIEKTGGSEFVLSELVNNKVRLTSLSKQLSLSPNSMTWNPYDDNSFFVVYSSNLYNIKSTDTALGDPTVSNIISYKYESNRKLYYTKKSVDGDVIVGRSNLDGTSPVVVIDSISQASGYKFAYSGTNNALAILNKDTGDLLLVYPTDGGKNTLIRLGTGYKNALWDKDNEKLMYYSSSRILSYDFDREQEIGFDYNGTIASVDWYFDDSHYLINGSAGLSIVEFDGLNGINLTFRKVSLVILDPSNFNLLYSEDESGKQVYYSFTNTF